MARHGRQHHDGHPCAGANGFIEDEQPPNRCEECGDEIGSDEELCDACQKKADDEEKQEETET